MQTILISFIVIGLGYLLIWGLCYAASKRREAWERENKQEWEIYKKSMQQIKKWSAAYKKDKKAQAEVEALFGSWAKRDDIDDNWLDDMRKQWETYDRQRQWEKLAEICKQETLNDIENLR